MSGAKRGQPAGVQTADGLYVIAGNYAAEKNAKLIPFVSKTVQVKGTVTEKDGQKGIVPEGLAKYLTKTRESVFRP